MRTSNTRIAGSGKPTLLVSIPIPCKGGGFPYTCISILNTAAFEVFNSVIVTPKYEMSKRFQGDVIETLPTIARSFPYRLIRSRYAVIYEEALFRYVESLCPLIVYVWPDLSLSLLAKLKAMGVIIVREMVNCHRKTAKLILDEEYARIGAIQINLITDRSSQIESEALTFCDLIFCSNAFSEKSVVENGISQDRVRGVSFGWDPARFFGTEKALSTIRGSTFLFVGYICVRKGAHLLLEYWANSGIRGRLVLVGKIEPAIAKLCRAYLQREDVIVVDYTSNIGAFYRSADVFVFPTLEEGGPQVSYEAAGCGLPLITSPMGAGRIAIHTSTGFVIDPFDSLKWIEAMNVLATSVSQRETMAAAAFERAKQFTWDAVASDRAAHMQDKSLLPIDGVPA
jgi:glycosyltransferase involved in cell wall biosynthesis